MIHNAVRSDIVQLVPPEYVDDECTDAVTEGVQLQYRYGIPATEPSDAGGTEPKGLNTGDEFSKNTSFAFVNDFVMV